MKKLLNNLYVTTNGSYVHKERKTLVIEQEGKKVFQLPFHSIQNLFCFGHIMVSPGLMATCGEKGISISFFSEYGKFQSRLQGPQSGNVLLRRAQYREAAAPCSGHVAFALSTQRYGNLYSIHLTLRYVMLVLITYDVKLTTEQGAKRLRHISKTCLDFGIRVQYSVFECEITPAQWVELKEALLNIYDPDNDSLRFYHLGSKWKRKVEHYGAKETPDMLRDTLIV